MSRARSFCRYCGALTMNLDSCCRAHRDVLRAEANLIPPDPLVTLPTMAASVRDCRACQGTGIEYPGLECPLCAGTGTTLPRGMREAVPPRKGTED